MVRISITDLTKTRFLPQPNSPYSSAKLHDRTFLFSAKQQYNEVAKEELHYER